MNEQAPSRRIVSVPACGLFAIGTIGCIIAAVRGSLWWLALPVAAIVLPAAGMALVVWALSRPFRRDEQLAQVIGLDELPRTDTVDLGHLDEDCWACDLERDTGLEEGERR